MCNVIIALWILHWRLKVVLVRQVVRVNYAVVFEILKMEPPEIVYHLWSIVCDSHKNELRTLTS